MEHSLWAYTLAITVLTLTPGVDTMLIIRNTTRGGIRDGAVSSLGICLGLFVHAGVSAVGISVLLLQSAWAFRMLKLAGAAYLVYLGIVSLKQAARQNEAPGLNVVGASSGIFSPGRSLAEGFLSNVLNPKAVVFYMAFLPQFIDPQGSAIKQSLFLACIHFVIAMLWQCLVASLVSRARIVFVKRAVKRGFDGMTGVIMMGFGLKLVLDR